MLSAIACKPENSRGRLFPESASDFRTAFQRDRDRIIHSTSFRRLKHKTQVFVEHEGDHYRTRLTHSIEVAQVARSISGALELNTDLTEAVALAHDLGHPPFGHSGEEVLNSCMEDYGGFDHNAQALRVVTRLERQYPGFDGLNLTWEALEGIAKHNGPVVADLPYPLAEYNAEHDLELHTLASAEAQVAALADDIAYNTHDLDDGLRAGLFRESDVLDLPIAGACFREADRRYPRIDDDRRRHTALRQVFDCLVRSVITESRGRLRALSPGNPGEIRHADRPVIAFPDSIRRDLGQIREFLFQHMYRHPKVQKVRDRASSILSELFGLYLSGGADLPDGWPPVGNANSEFRARIILDYVAGMTDRFALQEHARFTGRDNPLDSELRLW
ncbi:MAG: deoxyguanosinetriphosphate triphosphohydrolase [Rhodobacteraceae bacterium]|nr:deoxyguanosinetriphosphate triphosphohydrolase [Paracoccaceae bacterium]